MARPVAQIEIALPGYRAMSAQIEPAPGSAPLVLDEVAIELHALLNDLIMEIRKHGPVVSDPDGRN